MTSAVLVNVGPTPPANPTADSLWLSTALKDLRVSGSATDRRTILRSGLSWEANATQEPSVFFYNGYWHMLYTGGTNPAAYIGYAYAERPWDTWTKAATQVIGGGQGGLAGGIAHGSVYIEGGFVYFTGARLADNIFAMYRAPLSDFRGPNGAAPAFSYVADLLGLPASTTQLGNCYIMRDPDSTGYLMFMEALYQNNWQSGYATCPTLTGSYTMVQFPLPSLTPIDPNGFIGGPSIYYENGEYVNFVHGGAIGNGTLPTEGYRATSFDRVNWSIDYGGRPYIKRATPDEIDQVADLQPAVDDNGNWWMFWSGCSNRNSTFTILAAPMQPTLKRWDGKAWCDVLAIPAGTAETDYRYPPVVVTANYQARDKDDLVVIPSSASINITLPAASVDSRVRITHAGTNSAYTVSLIAGASPADTVLGANSAITLGQEVTARCRVPGRWNRTLG